MDEFVSGVATFPDTATRILCIRLVGALPHTHCVLLSYHSPCALLTVKITDSGKLCIPGQVCLLSRYSLVGTHVDVRLEIEE